MPSPSLINDDLKAKNENPQNSAQIKIDDFKKCKIQVGTVLECANIDGSDKLLKFKIDLGEDNPRQIISGIAKFYKPSELIGKQVCVLTNLKPAKIFKHESQGMILSAEDENNGTLSLLTPLKNMPNGSVIG